MAGLLFCPGRGGTADQLPAGQGTTLIYDPGERPLRAGTHLPVSVTIDRKRRQQGDNAG